MKVFGIVLLTIGGLAFFISMFRLYAYDSIPEMIGAISIGLIMMVVGYFMVNHKKKMGN